MVDRDSEEINPPIIGVQSEAGFYSYIDVFGEDEYFGQPGKSVVYIFTHDEYRTNTKVRGIVNAIRRFEPFQIIEGKCYERISRLSKGELKLPECSFRYSTSRVLSKDGKFCLASVFVRK